MKINNNDKQGIYTVGGFVRDTLMNKEPHDRDYCVIGYTSEQMIALGYNEVGKDFNVFLDNYGNEHALPRDYKEYAHKKKLEILKEDLSRRDLTINAMAMDEKGIIIDPFNGKRDIRDKIIRHINDFFKQDPLRILRVARFYSQLEDFTVAEETKTLMKEMVLEGALINIQPERIFKETEKALKTNNPRKYFELLSETGALYHIMPEVALLKGIPQPKEHHPEIDSFVHTMMVLEQATQLSTDPVVRFGAVLHDVGKILTHKKEWPKHIGHEKNGVPLVTNLCKRLKVPSKYKITAEKACEHHMRIHKAEEMKDKGINKLFVNIGKKQFELLNNLVIISKADARGRLGKENTSYPQAQLLINTYAAWNTVSVKKEADFLGKEIKDLDLENIKQIEHKARLREIKQARLALCYNKIKP